VINTIERKLSTELGSITVGEIEGKDHQRLVLLRREKQIFQWG